MLKTNSIHSTKLGALKRMLLILAFIFAFGSATYEASAQSYCTPYGYYTMYFYITNFTFNGINNSSSYSNAYYGYSDYSSIVSNPCTLGSSYSYSISGYDGFCGGCYSNFIMWVDWNHDGTFASNEVAASYTGYGSPSPNFNGTITIPSNAVTGNTRLRIIYGYYYYITYGYWGPCSTYAYYTEYEDYTINVGSKSNDAGVTAIGSPAKLFDSYKSQPISVTIKNFSKYFALTSCTINWSIGGVNQTPYNWTGNVAIGGTTSVTINPGKTFTAVSPWSPFHIEAWTTNPQGPDATANAAPDGDATNDKTAADIPCILNDAGFLNADAMIPIDYGNQNVLLTIKNYSPKPLTQVTINWSVNGMAQTPYTWVPSTPLASQATAVVNVGTYFFGSSYSPFTITASTSMPNGIADEQTSNDANTVQVYKALAGGTYYIGPTGSDYPDIVTVMNFINFWGLGGPVTFIIRPGTYQGNISLKPSGVRQFPMTFQSFTGQNFDVVVTAAPTTAATNYVFQMNGYNGVTFNGITMKNIGTSGFGTVINLTGGTNNITIKNCILNGLTGGANTLNYAVIKSDQNIANNINLTSNSINNGSVAAWFAAPSPNAASGLTIIGNTMTGMTWQGIHAENTSNTDIETNTLNGNGYNVGIYGLNSSVINNNRIINVVGTSVSPILSTEEAGIVLNHTSVSSDPATVTNNTISVTNAHGILFETVATGTISGNTVNTTAAAATKRAGITLVQSGTTTGMIQNNTVTVTNMDGIMLNHSSSNIYYNKVISNGSAVAGAKHAMVIDTSSSSWIANNALSGTNGGGLVINQSTNTKAYYNSINVNSNTVNALDVINDGAGNVVKRNIIMNNGGGLAVFVKGFTGQLASDQNDLFVLPATNPIGSFNGVTAATFAAWKTLSCGVSCLDANSSNVQAQFMGANDLRLAQVNSALYFNAGLPELLAAGKTAEIETNDFNGDARAILWYMGADDIIPAITINQQPNDVIACENSTNQQFIFVSSINYGAVLTYQWQKDGVDIPGATSAILPIAKVTPAVVGVYKCKVFGSAGATALVSNPGLCYSVKPTKITTPPQNPMVDMGGVASFTLDAHVNPTDPANFQPKFQWYRGSKMLTDNDRITGSNSSILTIKGLGASDYGSDYKVVVSGLCGSDSTVGVSLTASPKLTVTPLPAAASACVGSVLNLSVNATVSVTGVGIKYQWMLNGAKIYDNGRISGSNTKNLMVNNLVASDAGDYSCMVTTSTGSDLKTTTKETVSIDMMPVITTDLPSTVAAQTGKPFTLTVAASGTNLNYAWYMNNQLIANAPNAPVYTVAAADASKDAGVYYCVVSNSCGPVNSAKTTVAVTYFILMDVPEVSADGYTLSQNVPNPFANSTSISFVTPKTSYVRLVITDIFGKEVATIFDKTVDAGNYNVTFNNQDFNLASGVYYYTLKTDQNNQTMKMIIVK